MSYARFRRTLRMSVCKSRIIVINTTQYIISNFKISNASTAPVFKQDGTRKCEFQLHHDIQKKKSTETL